MTKLGTQTANKDFEMPLFDIGAVQTYNYAHY